MLKYSDSKNVKLGSRELGLVPILVIFQWLKGQNRLFSVLHHSYVLEIH